MKDFILAFLIWASVGNITFFSICKIQKQEYTASHVVVGAIGGVVTLLPLVIVIASNIPNPCIANCRN